MKFSINQKDLQQSLSYCQGVIEKRSTLPILSNVLIDASNSKLKITATDLDLIFINEIKNVEIAEEGKTTTTSSTIYDIIRKFSPGKKINFELSSNCICDLVKLGELFELKFLSMPVKELIFLAISLSSPSQGFSSSLFAIRRRIFMESWIFKISFM